jgi:hypothetical protein
MATKPHTITTIRAAIEALQGEYRRIENDEPNRAERVAGFEAFVRSAAATGDQRLAHLTAIDDPAEVFMLRDRTPDGAVNVASFLAAMDPAALLAMLCRHLPKGSGGLTTIEQRERLAAIAADLEALEVDEEKMIVASEVAGVPIARRADASCAAILGTWEAPAPAAVFEVAQWHDPASRTAMAARSEYLARGRE